MAQNTTVSLAANTWTQLTNADITSITFQNIGEYAILVKATTDETAPTTDSGAIRYNPGQGERNVSLSDMFPGLGSRDRLWAFCAQATRVVVSHA